MIGTKNYRMVSEVIAESQDLAGDALDRLLCMREHIVSSEVNQYNQYRRRLLNTLDGTYNYVAARHFNLSRQVQDFVKGLQQHVLDKYGADFGYLTLDEFLQGQYIQVPQTFAAISNFLGYTITEVGDKAATWEDLDNVNWNDLNLRWDRIGWDNL